MLVEKGGLLAVKGKAAAFGGGAGVIGAVPHPDTMSVNPIPIPSQRTPNRFRVIIPRPFGPYNGTSMKKVTAREDGVDITLSGTIMTWGEAWLLEFC